MATETKLFWHTDFLVEDLFWIVFQIIRLQGGAISLKNAAIPTARLINPRELEYAPLYYDSTFASLFLSFYFHLINSLVLYLLFNMIYLFLILLYPLHDNLCRVFRPHIEVRRDRQSGETFEILDGNMLKDGYLFKWVALNSLIYWGVDPTDSERIKFSPPLREGEEVDPEEWVSGLYDSRRKKSRASTSANLKASTSELMEDSTFVIHDLVLFGSVTAFRFLFYLNRIVLFYIY